MDAQYKVELDVFEGPLDLLLYLIKKDEVDIYNIPMERITKQYLEYLELMRMLDINVAGEFLVMASALIYIKSRMLLPPDERPQDEPEEEAADPRLDLVRQLLEYKRFKDAAGDLRQREILQERMFTRHAPPDVVKSPEMFLSDISIFDLIAAFKQALQKVETAGWPEIVEEKFTVKDKIDEIKERLREENTFSLTKLFDNMKSLTEVVVAFLALLELIRLKSVRITQEALFGEIIVYGKEYRTGH